MLEVIRDAGDNLSSVKLQPAANDLLLIKDANAPMSTATPIPQQMQLLDNRTAHMSTLVYHFAFFLNNTLSII